MSAPLLLCLGLVVGITDGDTVKVRCDKPDLGELKLRLDEIDAPEKKQAFGAQAKQALSDLAYRQDVLVYQIDTDKYGRTVARVERLDGLELNLEMVRLGYAWCYRKYLVRTEACLSAETQARESHRGLWTDPDPTPPSEWRHARGIGMPSHPKSGE